MPTTSRPWVMLFALTGCAGTIGDPGAVDNGGARPGPPSVGPGPTAPRPAAPGELTVGAGGIRRLSRVEYDNVLRDLLGDTTGAGAARLPEDAAAPFDNDYSTQIASGVLVETLEALATEATARALADPARRDALVGCKPGGPDDAACLRRFVTSFGRRALRRPLAESEIREYLALSSFAVEEGNFYAGVALAMRALLQDPELVYQVEIGTPVPGRPGLVRLTPFELASRLSFFLVGSGPGDALLDTADRLTTPDAVRATATALLADPRARARVDRFHALWLGYGELAFAPALAAPLRAESDRLVERTVFDGGRDYFELFRSTDSFVNDTLAQHYGLPKPGTATGKWVPYGAAPRRGILSHATVLAVGRKFDDTSPTRRGIFMRERLLCQEVPPPPPNVDVDKRPDGAAGTCKIDRYREHLVNPGCASCHTAIDGIGWGLENYDDQGRYRAVESDAPGCAIEGQGVLTGAGSFHGPGQLAELMIGTGALEGCVARQLYRFAYGRPDRDEDAPAIEALARDFRGQQRQFRGLALALVTSPAFFHRQIEEE